ncbi:MAG: hypothetical protein R3236_02570, partial [Phycisphaeraceae bacterium]|nr:hypothetical protein [Phycisphaeraceae bacterium]
MHLLCLGLSHKTAPVAWREKLSLGAEATADALQQLDDSYPGSEFFILSTCNRTECYTARPLHGHPRLEELMSFFADLCRVPVEELAEV